VAASGSKKTSKKSADMAITDDERESGSAPEDAVVANPAPRPRRRASARQAARAGSFDPEQSEHSSDLEQEQAPLISQAWEPPPSRRYRRKNTPSDGHESSLPASSPVSSAAATPEPEMPLEENILTPRASRKRAREESSAQGGVTPPAGESIAEPPSPAESQASRFSEVIIKRKRVRR
jgi:hypothetical protein